MNLWCNATKGSPCNGMVWNQCLNYNYPPNWCKENCKRPDGTLYEVGTAVNESFVNTNDANDYSFLLIAMLIIIFLVIYNIKIDLNIFK